MMGQLSGKNLKNRKLLKKANSSGISGLKNRLLIRMDGKKGMAVISMNH